MALVDKLHAEDHSERWEALGKLALYGAEASVAVPSLIAHLNVQDDELRTVYTLGKIGPPAKKAVPDLVLLLNGALNNTDKYSKECTLSVGIIQALGSIREQKELTVPVLRKALDHPYPTIRYEAAHALGELGGAAKSALPDLKKLTGDKERPPLYLLPYGNSVGEAAQDAIGHIQGAIR